jgi:hypothetical protein
MVVLEIIFIIFIFICIICYGVSVGESSGRIYGRHLNKKIEKISTAYQHNNKLEFNYKNNIFNIRVEKAKVPDGFRYSTIPVYTCKDVYINDELICKVHKLERLFTKAYVAEFSDSRDEFEITELINVAYKKAKQADKEYWNTWFAKQYKEKSFYDTKND